MDYDFLRFPEFRLKAVTLSYDDGMIYDKKMIEILDEYGLKCTFNLNSGSFSQNTTDARRRLTEKEAVELYTGSNHEVAVHGLKHLTLTAVPSETAVNDIIEDRKNLERLFGRIVKGMAYANGAYDDRAVEILRNCGINYARTTVSTEKFDIPTDWLRLPATCHHTSLNLPNLTEEFLKDDTHRYRVKPKLFYLWGHSYEFADNDNWNILEDFSKKVGRRSDVWYATNGEIYDYVRAFENLRYSVNCDTIFNPSCIDVWIKVFGKEVVIPAGTTVYVK